MFSSDRRVWVVVLHQLGVPSARGWRVLCQWPWMLWVTPVGNSWSGLWVRMISPWTIMSATYVKPFLVYHPLVFLSWFPMVRILEPGMLSRIPFNSL